MTTADNALLTAPATRWWLGWLLPPATILVIVVGAVLLLMTPPLMHFALANKGGNVALYPLEAAFQISDRTVADLLFGGDFNIDVGGSQFYTVDEVAHLRDARLVLYLFLIPAAFSLVLLVATLLRRGNDPRVWTSVARGGKVLVIGTVVLGVISVLAFGLAFTLFHQVFFPGGNWAFPPDSRLIALYPYAFWQLTAGALGVMCIVAGAAVWLFARRRAARLETRP